MGLRHSGQKRPPPSLKPAAHEAQRHLWPHGSTMCVFGASMQRQHDLASSSSPPAACTPPKPSSWAAGSSAEGTAQSCSSLRPPARGSCATASCCSASRAAWSCARSAAPTSCTPGCGPALGPAAGSAVWATPRLLGSAVSSSSAAARTSPWQSRSAWAQMTLSTPVKAQRRSTAARLGTPGPSEGPTLGPLRRWPPAPSAWSCALAPLAELPAPGSIAGFWSAAGLFWSGDGWFWSGGGSCAIGPPSRPDGAAAPSPSGRAAGS
mmetsp:Transcript_61209/g.147414  ORF Transcript_61209/g.147414 Transcript_61209/m.147414 type:complete len:265 (+) Transcript_61209:478-1272(+)